MERRQRAAQQSGADRETAAPGRLHIFFSYAPGTGKTRAMLEQARADRARGMDVAAGPVETHGRAEIIALLEGLPRIPAQQAAHAAVGLDLAAALRRRPQALIVDDLACANAGGSRHAKRYQDVEELLRAGIDVYATADVRHIESLRDAVAAITGGGEWERIPDAVFDRAASVRFVDGEPEALLAGQSAGGLTAGQLSALRALALRRCAERAARLAASARGDGDGYPVGEHILVCLSSAPSNQKIIRTGARMAAAFRGSLTALFVHTPALEAIDEDDRARLLDNVHLAERLGARVETVYGADIPYQIAAYARLCGATRVVLGRSGATRRHPWSRPPLTERLVSLAPELDIHIIPDAAQQDGYRPARRAQAPGRRLSPADLGKACAILLLTLLVSLFLFDRGVPETAIISLHILGVLLVSIATNGWAASTLAAAVSVLMFNFFFTEPRLTFAAYGKDYPVTFAVMFLVALLTGTLALRLKLHARQSAQVAFRTKVLFETNQLLQKAETAAAVVEATATQLGKLLGRNIVMYLLEGGRLAEARLFPAPDGRGRRRSARGEPAPLTGETEAAAAAWAAENNRRAGATTDTFSNARCLYLAIRVGGRVYGVAGVDMTGGAPDTFAYSIMLSILGECALALENIVNAQEKERAALLAQGEQLRANLLRAISHDLRTPLTSISGNASNLISNGSELDEAARRAIYTDIYDDAMWLVTLVENLLAATRIEEGRMELRMTAELVDEVVAEALRHVGRRRGARTITVVHRDDLLLARMDARLVMQVIINLVDNAIKYTPDGAHIRVETGRAGDMVEIRVADDGPGVPDAAKPRVFDMFFAGNNRVADSRRSLGLGLSLCRSIVSAHGGTITVGDNAPHGAVFRFTLPYGGGMDEQAADPGGRGRSGGAQPHHHDAQGA